MEMITLTSSLKFSLTFPFQCHCHLVSSFLRNIFIHSGKYGVDFLCLFSSVGLLSSTIADVFSQVTIKTHVDKFGDAFFVFQSESVIQKG